MRARVRLAEEAPVQRQLLPSLQRRARHTAPPLTRASTAGLPSASTAATSCGCAPGSVVAVRPAPLFFSLLTKIAGPVRSGGAVQPLALSDLVEAHHQRDGVGGPAKEDTGGSRCAGVCVGGCVVVSRGCCRVQRAGGGAVRGCRG